MYEKERFWVRLAGMPIWLEAKYPYTYGLFEDYVISPSETENKIYVQWREQAGLPVREPFSVTDQEIEEEQQCTEQCPDGYSADYLESLAVYRKISEALLWKNILLFHCSAIRYKGKVYLFTAPSGTGKSTHARLWREFLGEELEMVNDDKPLLGFEPNGQVMAYGTPYGGKDNLQSNISGPVKGILVLAQGEENKIQRMSYGEAYPLLFHQTYVNRKQKKAVTRTMDLVGRLALLPVYHMECTISREAAVMAYGTLTGDKKGC